MSQEFYLHQARKSVTFVFLEEPDQIQALGTGFFVGIKLNSGQGYAVYFVTAKHVLISKTTDRYHENILLRLNTKKGTVQYMRFELSKYTILTHDDPLVDLAAIPIYPSPDQYEYLWIPDDYFTTSKILAEKGIREGSRVFFAGLLSNFYYAKQKNYPVIRFGYISLLTEEPIEIMATAYSPVSYRFYLVECQSIGGFSGSPVFFERGRLEPDRYWPTLEIYLGGIMIGHVNDLEALREKNLELNVGLAVVTPCYLLGELLQTERARHIREHATGD
jgi:hypothetical protein